MNAFALNKQDVVKYIQTIFDENSITINNIYSKICASIFLNLLPINTTFFFVNKFEKKVCMNFILNNLQKDMIIERHNEERLTIKHHINDKTTELYTIFFYIFGKKYLRAISYNLGIYRGPKYIKRLSIKWNIQRLIWIGHFELGNVFNLIPNEIILMILDLTITEIISDVKEPDVFLPFERLQGLNEVVIYVDDSKTSIKKSSLINYSFKVDQGKNDNDLYINIENL